MVGRNDPCPCGSGKKYKKCCMPAEQVVSLAGARYERAFITLLSDLAAYCEGLPDEESEEAAAIFYGLSADGQPADEEEEAHYHFLDWLAFSHQTGDDGELILDRFARERTDPMELELLEAWRHTRPGIYRMEGAEGRHVHFRDCLTGQAYQVSMNGKPKVGNVLMGRLLPVGEGWRPSYELQELNNFPMAELTPVLEAELARMRLAYPEAGWDQLFAHRWPLVRDLVAIISTAVHHQSQIRQPALGPAQSLGRTSPPPEAPAAWGDVARLVVEHMKAEGLPFFERQSALRLWFDAADALKPKVTRPEAWAAGVLYTWHHWVAGDDMTQSDAATDLGVSATTAGQKARAIVDALGLVEDDDRYADPLDPLNRMNLCMSYLTAGTVQTLSDPILTAALEEPDTVAAAEKLNVEAQKLMNRQQWAAARSKLNRALDECPVFVPARNNLALSYYMENNYAAAVKAAEPVLDTHPEYVFTLGLLAEAHFRLGQERKAAERLTRAMGIYRRWLADETPEFLAERQSDRQRLWAALAALEWDRELWELARQEDLSSLDPQGWMWAAAAADRVGERAVAKEWLARAREAWPQVQPFEALLGAIRKMEEGLIPAFRLDFDTTLESLQPGSAHLSALARAVAISMIWGPDARVAEGFAEGLALYGDPWVVELGRAVLAGRGPSERVKMAALTALRELGAVKRGQKVEMLVNGVMRSVTVK